MEHPFLTNRNRMHELNIVVDLADDMLTLLGMSYDDYLCMRERREPDAKTDTVKSVLTSRTGLGLMLKELDEHSSTLSLHKVHGDAWSAFLQTSRETDTSSLVTALKEASAATHKSLLEIQNTEQDDGSSSCSDYSDSRTVSSEGEEEEEGEEESGDEEEEEESEEEEDRR